MKRFLYDLWYVTSRTVFGLLYGLVMLAILMAIIFGAIWVWENHSFTLYRWIGYGGGAIIALILICGFLNACYETGRDAWR